MKYLFLVFGGLAFFACEDDDYPVQLKSEEVIRLLTDGESKSWARIPTIACEQDDIISFSISKKKETPAIYTLKKGSELCPEESETDIAGSWELEGAGNIDKLTIYGKDTMTYEITLITYKHLQLRNTENEWEFLAL